MRMKSGIISIAFAAAILAQQPAGPGQAPAAAPGASGQPGRGMGGGRGPALRSAEISDDQKVTFRLRAPNATEVARQWRLAAGARRQDDEGRFRDSGRPLPGPLTPELWSYTFSVDGVSLLDSANANILRDGTRYLELPHYRRTAFRHLQDQRCSARQCESGMVRLSDPGRRFAAPDVRLHACRV